MTDKISMILKEFKIPTKNIKYFHIYLMKFFYPFENNIFFIILSDNKDGKKEKRGQTREMT